MEEPVKGRRDGRPRVASYLMGHTVKVSTGANTTLTASAITRPAKARPFDLPQQCSTPSTSLTSAI